MKFRILVAFTDVFLICEEKDILLSSVTPRKRCLLIALLEYFDMYNRAANV